MAAIVRTAEVQRGAGSTTPPARAEATTTQPPSDLVTLLVRRVLPLVLLLGVLSMGIAAGIAAGAYLATRVGSQSYVYPVTIFFFTGLSLVIAYYLLRALPADK